MSVLYEDGKTEINCDGCGKSPTGHAYEKGQFNDMVTDAKLAGFDFKPKKYGGWTHTCRECRVKAAAALLNL